MRHRAPFIWLAAAVLAGCSRAGEGGGAARPSAPPPASPVNAAEARDAYVRRVLADTAVDLRQCRRRPALQDGGDAATALGEVVLAVDSSGSMAARAGAGSKMDEAKAAVSAFLSGLPQGARGGLLVFGDVGDNSRAGKARSCAAPVRFSYGPEVIDAGRVRTAVDALHPAGWTPLARAIDAAAAGFTTAGTGKRTLYVVSDGVETCGGDPVAAAAAARRTARVVVNVVGFDVRAPAEAAALRRVAEAGGGAYQSASTGNLRNVLLQQLSTAHSANSTGMFKAMWSMHDCYMDGLKRQSELLVRRIDDDRRSGRADSGQLLAASRAGSDRTMAGLKENTRFHEENMRDTDAANRAIENRVDALDAH